MAYELRWGKLTWVVALVVSGVIGIAILWLDFQKMGVGWHGGYYMAMLGYYVMFSICQSHYFKSKPVPNWEGFARQWVSITSAVMIFYVNRWFMGEVIGLPSDAAIGGQHINLLMGGQFFFIVLGFFIFGMDDFLFKGALSRRFKHDAHKAILWLAVIYVLWYVLYVASWGLSRAQDLDTYNDLNNNIFLGCFQWSIMMSMMIAITWRDFIEKIKWKSDFQRGAVLLPFVLGMGAVLGYVSFLFIGAIQPAVDPGAVLTDSYKWHHVLYMGTFPLIPIIIFGLYTNHLNSIEDVGKKTAFRTAWVATWVIAGYFIFHYITMASGLFTPASAAEPEWFHGQDLIFNFTVSIIPLSHHWFCGRLGFMKEEKAEK
ncbi:MAG: hypothetical protein V1934_03595 [Methanobacteriota archaeon]